MKPDKQIKKLDTVDKLIQHYQKPELHILTDEEKLIAERWHFCSDLIRSGKYDRNTIIGMLKSKYGLSQAQAYRDYGDTKTFFNSSKPNKQFYRDIYAERAEALSSLSQQMGDLKTALYGVEVAGRIRGLDKDDPDMPDFSALEQHEIIINLNPVLIKALIAIAQSGAVNLSDLRQDISTIEDANAIVIPNGEKND